MNTTQNDGGPAFPYNQQCDPFVDTSIINHPGMTLRDWFAGQALAGMLQYDATGLQAGHVPKRIATDCYAIADAMLAAREKGNQP